MRSVLPCTRLSPPLIRRFYFNVFDLDDFEKARHAVYMFKDLFGLSRFDEDSLIRFTLTVRKNYRRVPYHNWTHGFSVANTMYAIIKHSGDVFREEEVGAHRSKRERSYQASSPPKKETKKIL